MKRYIVVVSATLLTLAPMKLLTMEKEKFKTLSKMDIESSIRQISEKYTNITEIHDTKTLRTGIFETTVVIVQSGNENVSRLKEQRKALRKRLLELQPKQSQEQIFDISSPESDDESDSPKLTNRTFYTKYEKAELTISKNKSRSLGFEQNISKVEQQKSKKLLEIERLQQSLQKAQEENNNLGTQIATQKEESAVAKEAIAILQLKKEALKQNMGEQELSLAQEIKETSQEIIELKEELSRLTDKEDIKNKKSAILTKEKELKELKSAFEFVKKDLNVVNGKGGLLAPLLFGVNLYSYSSTVSKEDKELSLISNSTEGSEFNVEHPSDELSLIEQSSHEPLPTPTDNLGTTQATEIFVDRTEASLSIIEMSSDNQTPATNEQRLTDVVIELGEMQTPRNTENTETNNEDKKDK